MGVYETKLCVIVQHNGEPSRKDDTVIRKLMRFSFVLRYYESWAGALFLFYFIKSTNCCCIYNWLCCLMLTGNEFDWCNDGVVLDFFDFCYLRVHLHDAHREKIKKCDQHRYALRSLRVAGGLLCSFRYKDGYPVGMFLWRTVHELPPQLQSVHVVEGYKGLQHLLEAALMHVHKVTKLPFNSEPDFFQTLDWHTVVG